MKMIAGLMVVCWLLLLSCSSFSSTDAVQEAIPGVYAAGWTTAFTAAWDTIHIAPAVNAGSGTYEITRRTAMYYQNKPQYKIVHWTGVFESSNKTIIVNNNGRILSFDLAKSQMKMGSTVYKKL